MSNTIIIGVAGGSGSGKTFFAQALAKSLGSDVACLIYQDNYYIDQSNNFDFDGGRVNFDHPKALDFALMVSQLKDLKNGFGVEIPTYEFSSHKRLSKTLYQEAKRVVIVDGILILTQPELRDLFDISIFVQTPENIRFTRRLERDVQERGRTQHGVRAQFENQVKPMHDLFVEPSKLYADIVSSGTDMEALHRLLEKIQQEIFNPTPILLNPTYQVSLENSLP